MPKTALRQTTIGLLLVLCFVPVLVGRGPYRPAWDDSVFLRHTVCVNRALSNHDLPAFRQCLTTLDKGPLMALLGIPWGQQMNSPAGLGLAFFSLSALAWVQVVTLITLLFSLHVPYLLIAAAAATLPLNPFLRSFAGSYYADMPVALAVAIGCLLLPLEARAPASCSRWASVLRGCLWGLTLAVGVLGKTTFLLFAAIIGPFLLIQRWRVCGRAATLCSLASTVLVASPAIFITFTYWEIYYQHSQIAAFGPIAQFYSRGLDSVGYLAEFIRSSVAFSVVAGLLLVGFLAALFRRKREAYQSLPGLFALVIYGSAVITSPNHDPRFMMPLLVGLPIALLGPWARPGPNRKESTFSGVPVWLLAGFIVSVPLITRCETTQIVGLMRFLSDLPATGNRIRVVIATDSPAVNHCTMWLANELVLQGKPSSTDIETVVYDQGQGMELQHSLGKMAAADYIVMQPDEKALSPEWTNQRFAEYRQAALASGRLVPELSSELFEVYAVQRTPQRH